MTDSRRLGNHLGARQQQRPQGRGRQHERQPRKRSGSLSAKLLPELQQLAGDLGISGTAKLRKSELIAAIQAKQSGGGAAASSGATADGVEQRVGRRRSRLRLPTPRRDTSTDAIRRAASARAVTGSTSDRAARTSRAAERRQRDRQQRDPVTGSSNNGQRPAARVARAASNNQAARTGNDQPEQQTSGGGNQNGNDGPATTTSSAGATAARRGRFRERNRGRGGNAQRGDRFGQPNEPDPVITDDDVLVPVAGIVDILDNYAFVRTSGYLPGPDDIYVSLSQVRRNGLRKGDAVTGAVRQPREGERKREVQRAGAARHGQRRRPGGGQEAPGLRQADPAVPAGPAAARDRARHLHHAGHRPGRPDRQGPARPDRLAAEGRQDDGAAGDRQRHHHEQPRDPPHGRPRRRAARRGHRHAALGEG